ncbi:MAG: hypothetical protein AAF432_08105 [Planctomycetota bacterium]
MMHVRWLLLIVLLVGCASDPEPVSVASDDVFGIAPQDFALDVLVAAGPDQIESPLAHRRPGRFVVFPDGALHFGTDLPPAADRLPPERRVLKQAQMAQLWGLLGELGLDAPDAGEPPRSEQLIMVGEDETVTLITVTAGGERWQVARLGPGDTDDAVATPLVRYLASLAWAADIPEPERLVRPVRYDFGPDPYARYRIQRR